MGDNILEETLLKFLPVKTHKYIRWVAGHDPTHFIGLAGMISQRRVVIIGK